MNTDAQHSSSNSVRRFARWLLISLLIAVVAMGWNWTKNQGYIANLQQIGIQYVTDADIFGSRTRTMIAKIESAQLAISQRLDQLAANWLSIDNQRRAIARSDNQAIANSGQGEKAVDIVVHLINSAYQFLQLAGDTESAQAALEQALKWVRSNDQLMDTDIEAALMLDIQQLEQASRLDRMNIYREIGRYAERIDRLPLAMYTNLQTVDLSAKRAETADSSIWARFFTQIWQDLCQLVRIKKLDSKATTLLSPSQIQLLHGNVKLQLKQAQLALLTRDRQAFSQSLETTLDLINDYFDTQQPSVIELQEKLNHYERMAAKMVYPDSLASLQILQSIQMKLKREDE